MENKTVTNDAKKVGKSFGSMFKRLFLRDKPKLSVLEEEAIQTPAQTIIKNFFRSRLGIIGIITFVLVMTFSFLGSHLRPINLSYQETTMRNIRPGVNHLKYPSALEREGVRDISVGTSFSIGVSEQGNVFVWGTQPIQIVRGLSTSVIRFPEELKNANVTHVAAGDRHALAYTADHKLYAWGNDNHYQGSVPDMVNRRLGTKAITQLFANDAYSGVLFEDGEIIIWGSVMVNRADIIPEEVQFRVQKVSTAFLNVLMLLDDGTVYANGVNNTPLHRVPEHLKDGSVNVVDIAASNRSGLALDDQGELHIWGSPEHGVMRIPDFNGTPVSIAAGRNNFAAVLDTGEVVYWGADHFGQMKMPSSMANANIVDVKSGYFGNYAIDDTGKIHAWGLSGFVFGSDHFGRDNLTRLIHGGRISLTVGAISVIISVIVALLIGMPSGFFGGWVDHALMRIADFVIAIPFLPLAITLSTIVTGRVSEMYRIYMIMIIIGFLSWPGLARLVRAQILVEREKDFVLAARALGVKHHNIIIRHILPNVFNLVLVSITLGYAGALLSEAGLSFLGFGVSAPTPSWGNMLQGAQSSSVIEYYWWRWLIPGAFVLIAALSINLVGDALRDAMDPKANEK